MYSFLVVLISNFLMEASFKSRRYQPLWNAEGGAENAGQENDGQKSSREKQLDGGLPLPTPFRYHFTTYSFLLIHLVPVI